MTEASPAPDGDTPDRDLIEYRKDGGINVWLENDSGQPRRIRLRAPRLREFRKLIDAWRDALTEMDEESREAREWADEMARRLIERDKSAKAAGEAVGIERTASQLGVMLGMTPEERRRDRELLWKQDDAWEQRANAWWALAIATLAPDGTDADGEDLPMALAQMDTVGEAIQHWRSVPSRSGVQ